MRKTLFLLGCAAILALAPISLRAADSPPTDNVNKRVHTTNGDTINPQEIQKLPGPPATGGGAVAASMGTQTGEGSSSSPRVTTTANDDQPQRGVSIIYILGLVAAGVVGFLLFARRRT